MKKETEEGRRKGTSGNSRSIVRVLARSGDLSFNICSILALGRAAIARSGDLGLLYTLLLAPGRASYRPAGPK